MYYYLKNMTENNDEDSKGSLNIKVAFEELRILEDEDTVDAPARNNEPTKEMQDESDPFSEACTQNLEEPFLRETDKKRSSMSLPRVKEQLYVNDFRAHDDAADKIQLAIEHDYLFQPSNIKVAESPKFKTNNLYVNSSRLNSESDIFLYSPTEEQKAFVLDTPTSDISQITLSTKDIRSSCSIKSGKESNCPLTGQEELAEIINDFKNNVFTISEVEKLVMEWKNRNETQQSLKEKQEQLNKMRKEYDKLQHKIKENMKRPTPFERVKKMFSKSKNKRKFL